MKESVIKELMNWVSWYDASVNNLYPLSIDFAREFEDKLNWNHISQYKTLSRYFIITFKDKLDLDLMLKYNNISKALYHELKYGKLLTRSDLLDFA